MLFSQTSLWLLACLMLRICNCQSIGTSTNSTSPDPSVTLGLVIATTSSPQATAMPAIFLQPLNSSAANVIPAAGTGLFTFPAFAPNNPNFSSVVSTGIVLIQCDPDSNSDPLQIFIQAVASAPQAIVLFSNTSAYCTYTPGTYLNQNYNRIFTTTSMAMGQIILGALRPALADRTQLYASIVKGASSSSPGSTGGPSTQVAMIILYSITGVITALFLIIIVTGAIRAHRHPERYGPRNIIGRARQSRARGLGRAILDTLPIVKFGEQDEEPKPNTTGDVEMAGAATAERSRTGPATQTTPLNRESWGSDDAGPTSPGIQEIPAAAGAVAATTAPGEPVENPGCSICTDDFERGQDVRVLPCSHQFHPSCIDPWLLNVSGTCPLCRVDLRPGTAQSNHTTTSNFLNNIDEESQAGTNGANSRSGSFAPPLEGTDGLSAPAAATIADRRSRRMSGFLGTILNPRRMQDASTQERLAALRRARDHRASQGEDEAEIRRSRRLTARLHDSFRIRTRPRSNSREGRVSPEAAAGAAAPMPASLRTTTGVPHEPAPAHISVRDHAVRAETPVHEAGADIDTATENTYLTPPEGSVASLHTPHVQ